MRNLFASVSVLVCLLSISTPAAIINIPDDYQSIQQGIDACSDGDTVLIQPGTYLENIIITNTGIVMASEYLISEDTAYISATIIDGGDNGPSIRVSETPDGSSMICGFTIQNGRHLKGGGLYLEAAEITVCHNIIKNNHAAGDGGEFAYGGGIYCLNCSPVITENVITYNSADYFPYKDGFGGGICCFNADATITKNIITYNTASGVTSGGGGFYGLNSNPVMAHNIVTQNVCNWGSGIFYDTNCNGAIERNIIYENYGGGILCRNMAQPSISNNTIAFNYWVGGITCADHSAPEIVNNIVWANELYEVYAVGPMLPEIIYNNIRDGWDGEGNIDSEPMFVDSNNGNFNLQANSPCIDTGNPETPYDPDNTRADIGALYFDQTTALDDDPNVPSFVSLNQNYPNPFNASTVIEYELPRPADIKIEVYDILGRLLGVLQNGIQQAGYHQAIWNADGFSSGVFIYKLQIGEYIETRKMMLLK